MKEFALCGSFDARNVMSGRFTFPEPFEYGSEGVQPHTEEQAVALTEAEELEMLAICKGFEREELSEAIVDWFDEFTDRSAEHLARFEELALARASFKH